MTKRMVIVLCLFMSEVSLGETNSIAREKEVATNMLIRVEAGAVTNVFINKTGAVKSQTVNVSIVSEPVKECESKEGMCRWWQRWGLSESTLGMILGSILTALGVGGKFLLDMIRSCIESHRSLAAQRSRDLREDKQRVWSERKEIYEKFIAFYFVVLNKLRADADTPVSRDKVAKEWDLVLPPNSIREAAEINAKMQVAASETVAARHLEFMETYKSLVEGQFGSLQKGLDSLSEALKGVCSEMRRELEVGMSS